MPPEIAQLSLSQVERALASLSEGEIAWTVTQATYRERFSPMAVAEVCCLYWLFQLRGYIASLALLYLVQGRYADALPLVQTAVRKGGASPAVALPVLLGANGQALISADDALDDYVLDPSLRVRGAPGAACQ
jgi:hypothetical protein